MKHGRSFLRRFCTLVVFFSALGGCAVTEHVQQEKVLSNQKNYLQSISEAANRKVLVVNTPLFPIQTVGRVTDPSKPLVVYVEGDGHVYEVGGKVSTDPTPLNPIGLQLSAIDRSPNVVYIARPCQYVGNIHDTSTSVSQCRDSVFWTSARYAPEVVQAISIAVDIWKAKLPSSAGIHLVGYSGAATITGILAGTRKDILSWRTIAGLVDWGSLLRSQGRKPYGRSMDVKVYRRILQNIPQIHYVGSRDKQIPGWILKGFLDTYVKGKCSLIVSADASHSVGWLKPWANYWQKLPYCS